MNTIKWLSITPFLLYAASVRADWCDGSKFMLLAMPMSERVQKAGESLQQLQQALTEETARLQLDINQNSLAVKNALAAEFNSLKVRAVELCEQGQSGRFPLQYRNLSLADPLELRAQASLDLQLLAAQQAALADVDRMRQTIEKTMKATRQKNSELALLVKQRNGQADNPEYNRRFLQQACIASVEGRDLLRSLETVSLDTLLAEKIRQLKLPVEDAKLDKFLAACRYGNEPTTMADSLKDIVKRLRSWF